MMMYLVIAWNGLNALSTQTTNSYSILTILRLKSINQNNF
jgi:hypothetical protein